MISQIDCVSRLSPLFGADYSVAKTTEHFCRIVQSIPQLFHKIYVKYSCRLVADFTKWDGSCHGW